MSISYHYNCCLLFRPATIRWYMYITGWMVGNARGYKILNLAINTHFKCKKYYVTREAFILPTLDAQWITTTLQNIGRKELTILHNSTVWYTFIDIHMSYNQIVYTYVFRHKFKDPTLPRLIQMDNTKSVKKDC